VATDSFPYQGHNNRQVSLAEYEQMVGGALGVTGYTGGYTAATQTTPLFADGSGLQSKIRAGTGLLVRGFKMVSPTVTAVPHQPNNSGLPRIDLVVARLNRAATAPNAFAVTPQVIQGTPAASPVAPTPVRQDTTDGTGLYDFPMGQVAVAAGATTILDANVTNTGWWLTPSGYTAPYYAEPPAESGLLFRETVAGATWVGTANGNWQRLYSDSGWIDVTPASGFTGDFLVYRVGRTVWLSCRLTRTGADVNAATSITMGTVGVDFRPSRAVGGVYHCSSIAHSGPATVNADGTVVFGSGQETKVSGSAIFCNMTWPSSN